MNCDISVSPNSPDMGSVSGQGRFHEGYRDTITAYPTAGYRFVQWSDGNTSNPRTFIVTQDTSFTAIFATAEKYRLDLSVNNPEWGSVSGGGVLYAYTDCQIQAFPTDERFAFSHWSDGPADNPRTIRISSDSSITAIFYEDFSSISRPNTPHLKLMPNPTSSNINLHLDQSDIYVVEIFDQLGHRVIKHAFEGTRCRIRVADLNPGTYVVNVHSSRATAVSKFVKK